MNKTAVISSSKSSSNSKRTPIKIVVKTSSAKRKNHLKFKKLKRYRNGNSINIGCQAPTILLKTTAITNTTTTLTTPTEIAGSNYVYKTNNENSNDNDNDKDDVKNEDNKDMDDIPCDVLLAFYALVQSRTIAYCPLLPTDKDDHNRYTCHAPAIPLVLRPMIHHSLWSKSMPGSNAHHSVQDESDRAGTMKNGLAARIQRLNNSMVAKTPSPTSLTTRTKNSTGERISHGDRIASANASTGVRIELDSLCQTGKIRMVQLHGCGGANFDDDVAVMEGKDYVRAVWDAHRFYRVGIEKGGRSLAEDDRSVVAVQDDGGGGGSSGTLEEKGFVVGAFVKSRGWSWNSLFVTERELLQELSTLLVRHRRCHALAAKNPTRVDDDGEDGGSSSPSLRKSRHIASWAIDYLVSIDILLPRHTTVASPISSYWFTLPKMAVVAKSISSGRSRMLAVLRRSRYKEVKRAVLERRNRKQKVGEIMIGGEFFVKDLLARGVIRVRCMPSGQFIKLV